MLQQILPANIWLSQTNTLPALCRTTEFQQTLECVRHFVILLCTASDLCAKVTVSDRHPSWSVPHHKSPANTRLCQTKSHPALCCIRSVCTHVIWSRQAPILVSAATYSAHACLIAPDIWYSNVLQGAALCGLKLHMCCPEAVLAGKASSVSPLTNLQWLSCTTERPTLNWYVPWACASQYVQSPNWAPTAYHGG